MKRKLSTFLRLFGPAKRIDYRTGAKLPHNRVATLVDPGTGTRTLYLLAGFHFVNRLEMYEVAKPIDPKWYSVDVYDISFNNEDPLQLPES